MMQSETMNSITAAAAAAAFRVKSNMGFTACSTCWLPMLFTDQDYSIREGHAVVVRYTLYYFLSDEQVWWSAGTRVWWSTSQPPPPSCCCRAKTRPPVPKLTPWTANRRDCGEIDQPTSQRRDRLNDHLTNRPVGQPANQLTGKPTDGSASQSISIPN